MIKYFYLFIFLIYLDSASGQPIQREGLVNYFSSMDSEGFRRYTWFEDSTIIFEIYENYSESRNDTMISQGFRLAYYSILDLSTMHAQDYLLFSDDCEPLTNYYLKDNETISWGSYSGNQETDKYVDSLVSSSDTVVDGKKLKRFWCIVSGPNWKIKLTCGMNCSDPKTIFHFNRALDKQYHNCQVTYFQYEDLSSGFTTYSKLSFIRDSLTNTEKLVFKKWKANLKNTSISSTSFKTAREFISRLRSVLRYHR